MLHLASIVTLLYRIRTEKNCRGISCKTQELYMIVFATRYIDLFVHFIGIYITFMKLAYLGSTAYIIYLMNYKRPFSITYIRENDSFDYLKYLIPPCAILSIIFTSEFGIMEIL
mmetsp:Transcript_27686/g.5077  ORF Transcript_27686/g.5077 Transcript_27686/m.5077 type:complete len:114 (-) Transcript_27686:314-655(-)